MNVWVVDHACGLNSLNYPGIHERKFHRKIIALWRKRGYLKELLQYSMGFGEKNDFYPTMVNT
jgi:hypothetical protein